MASKHEGKIACWLLILCLDEGGLFGKGFHQLYSMHSVLREIKMFKNSYIVVNNVEIRLVCVHRPKTAFLD